MARRWLFIVFALTFAFAGSQAHAMGEQSEEVTWGDLWRVSATSTLTEEADAKKRTQEEKRLAKIFDEDEELALLTDYHPTVDRWTERNNRIRVTTLVGVWFYSGELDVRHHVATGLRVSWEVPGFIAIHFEAMTSPFARLEVKPLGGVAIGGTNPRTSRHADGIVSSAYLSIAIFNPELSNEDLAFWAGFGAGFFYFDFSEDNVINGLPSDVNFDEFNPSAKIFIEIDYRVTPTIHVGFGIAGHVLYAEHTDDGRFYDVNGVQGGVAGGIGALTQEDRNDGTIGHLAFITDIHLTISIVF